MRGYRHFLALLLIMAVAAPVLAQGGACAAPLDFQIGDRARVRFTDGTGNRLRSQPTTSGSVLAIAPEGSEFTIVGGPTCADGYNWWQVSLITQSATGWMAEGMPGNYWIEPALVANAEEAVTGSTGGHESQTAGLPGPPGALPVGVQRLRLTTLDLDGTLGVYESGSGWRMLSRLDEDASLPALSPDGGRVAAAAGGRVYVLDAGSGATLQSFDWPQVTGNTALAAEWVAWTADGSGLLVTVSERNASGFPRSALYRVDPNTLAVTELLPLSDAFSLQGPPGEPPQVIVTPDRVIELPSSDKAVPVVVHSFDPAPTFGGQPYIPRLSWLTGGAAYYVIVPQQAGSSIDLVAWQLTPGGVAVEVLRVPDVNGTGEGLVSPSGRYLAVSYWADNAVRVYDLAAQEAERVFDGLTTLYGWTPDSSGFIAAAPPGPLTYHGLNGDTTSAYLPDVPALRSIFWLRDGTAIFRHVVSGGTELGVMRPGAMPFAVRNGADPGSAVLLP